MKIILPLLLLTSSALFGDSLTSSCQAWIGPDDPPGSDLGSPVSVPCSQIPVGGPADIRMGISGNRFVIGAGIEVSDHGYDLPYAVLGHWEVSRSFDLPDAPAGDRYRFSLSEQFGHQGEPDGSTISLSISHNFSAGPGVFPPPGHAGGGPRGCSVLSALRRN